MYDPGQPQPKLSDNVLMDEEYKRTFKNELSKKLMTSYAVSDDEFRVDDSFIKMINTATQIPIIGSIIQVTDKAAIKNQLEQISKLIDFKENSVSFSEDLATKLMQHEV